MCILYSSGKQKVILVGKINFAKCIMTSDIIKDVIHFQKGQYQISAYPSIQVGWPQKEFRTFGA